MLNTLALVRRHVSWQVMSRYFGSGNAASVDRHFLEVLSSSVGGVVSLKHDEQHNIDIITLHHEKKKNALSGQMMLQLEDIISRLENSNYDPQNPSSRAILVTSIGDCFSSGADFDLVKQNLTSTFAKNMNIFMTNTLQRLRNLPQPSIAVINGPAFGGGAELAISCDLRLVTSSAKIRFLHGRLGITPAWGGAGRLVQLVGAPKTMDLLLTGRCVGADEMVSLGLASSHVPGDSILAWIGEWLLGSAKTLAAMKKVVQVTSEHEGSSEREREIFVSTWGGKEQLLALEKVLNK